MLKEQLLILLSTPFYLVVIGTEILISHLHLKKYYKLKDTLINVYLCVINGGIDLLFRAVYLVILLWHGVAPNDEQLKVAYNQLPVTLGDY